MAAATSPGTVVTVDGHETSNLPGGGGRADLAACGDDDDSPPDSVPSAPTVAGRATTVAGGDATVAGVTAGTADAAPVSVPAEPVGTLDPNMSRDEAAQQFKDTFAQMGVEVTDDQVDCVLDGAEEAGLDASGTPDAEALDQFMTLFTDCGIDIQAAVTGAGG